MSSIILELQRDVISSDCDVLTLLRKAHLVAAKLNLEEFDEWISYELYGYKNNDSPTPEYRVLCGSVMGLDPYRGWLPVIMRDNKTEESLSKIEFGNSISDIVEFGNKSEGFTTSYDAERNLKLNSACGCRIPTQFSLHFSAEQMKSIIEHVKNTILEWTIKLEKEGIVGEDMQFNSEEKESAKRIPQQITNYNYYGNTNVINIDEVQNSAIVTGDGNTIIYNSPDVLKAISEIESSLNNEDISSEDKEIATEMIAEIREKVSKNKKPAFVKSAFIGLKDFLLGVGASLTATLIQSKIQGLF